MRSPRLSARRTRRKVSSELFRPAFQPFDTWQRRPGLLRQTCLSEVAAEADLGQARTEVTHGGHDGPR